MQDQGRSALDADATRPLSTLCGVPLGLATFLPLAVRMSEALAGLHRQQIVHKNLRPWHILLSRDSGTVLFTDPGVETAGDRAFLDRSAGHVAEDAPAYMSPEQLGRLSRVVDGRSDLYSLGVIFYELLTGKPPFQAEDLLEWVHCHVARLPRAPIQIIPDIPQVISDIVMKLLAKSVEERYQTALGLHHDLARCLRQLENDGTISPFALARGDISDQLVIPEKLYGRQKDIDLLCQAFERVRQRGVSEMVMIAGYSGIGKSSLVAQLIRPVVRERGFFISGKFDQYKRNIPYATIIEAFQGLIRQILTENETRLGQWKEQLQRALGRNGQIIIDIFPRVELIIGHQPPVPELPAMEAESRFNLVLRHFLKVFSQKAHPLVLFLDDLQWADSASLKLIEHIITDRDTGHLLLIGAYRDNEVGATHPLMLTIDSLGDSRAIIQNVHLSPLSFADTGRLVADTFHVDPLRHEAFVRLVYEKTGGNPFFVIQFLMTLHSERLVTFNLQDGCWTWDIDRILSQGYSDNVVDLMTAKLKKMVPATREALRLGASIGSRFTLRGLRAINGSAAEETETRQCLEEAVKEMLLVSRAPDHYAFAHDRVQQAAYLLTPEEERPELHLRIGRLMLLEAEKGRGGERIFEIVNQLNLGGALISDRAERHRLAELNLLAGRKAKSSSAYGPALNYFAAGASLLVESDWQIAYDLTFSLYRERGEAEYLNSNYARSREIIDLLLGKAQSDLQRAELYNILIIQHTLLAEYGEALACGRKALNLLDMHLPESDFRREFEAELARYRQILGDRQIASLADVPEMTDFRQRVSLELLANMLVPARYSDSSLFALITVIAVNLSLQYGPTAKSTVGYAGFGMLLQSVMNTFQDGYDFGDLALRISERFDNPAQKCQACMVLGHYLNHWVRHLKWADDFLSEGIREGLAAGERQWTGYSLAYKLFQPFYRGVPLPQLRKEIPVLLSYTVETKNEWATATLIGLQLALARLMGSGSPEEEAQEPPSDDTFLDECRARNSFGVLGRYAVLKVQIHYLFGQLAEARQAVAQAREMYAFFSSSISVAELNFYSSLLFLALSAATESEPDRAQYLESVAENQQTMHLWSENCQENFSHQYLLVEAERARLAGRVLEAEQLYEQAGDKARAHGFGQDEALIHELAARFYADRELTTVSRAYLREARACYLRWGAYRKVRQLDRLHPGLYREEEEAATRAFGLQLGSLDGVAVIKASQAISGEIVLDRLVETLMRTVLEHGGAQKGLLILVRDDELRVEAEARVVGQEVKVTRLESRSLAAILPESLVNYVKRTGEAVILDDAGARNMFGSDRYLQHSCPLSMVCLPLTRQARITGMLYLENNLVRQPFTKQKMAVLELLAAQAAISLENAVLYQECGRAEQALRESEEKYRAIFLDSGTPLMFIEEDKTISICNRAFERLSGYSRAETEGRKKWPELVANPEDLARMEEYHRLRRVDPRAAPATYEFQLLDRQGGVKDVVATVAMMKGTGKSLGALLDISERKRALAALHRSEQKFKAIFERSFQFMGLLAVDGTLLGANATALDFIGVEEAAVVGLPFWDTPWVNHSPELRERMRTAVKEASAGRFVRFEVSHRSADGELIFMDFSLKPVKDESGAVVLIIPEGRDITERKQAEEENARLVTAIEQSAEAVIITDTGFIVRYANPALAKMSGYRREEVVGSHTAILASDRLGRQPFAAMFDTLSRGDIWSGRLYFNKKDGSSYEAEVTASPVRDKAGAVINYVSIHRDITREVQLERELRQVHKMEAIGTLAGGIAHDFNNILTVIQGHAQLSTFRLPADSPLRNSLEQILVSCSRAKDMVSQILTFSRQAEQEKKPVQLVPLVNEVLKLLRASLPTTITIIFNSLVTLKQSVILANATQIHQVLMNLATNGAHAMAGQGGTLTVQLSRTTITLPREAGQPALPLGSYVVLSVKDTGRGIEGAVVERIFDPYFTTKGPGEGSGMGLAVTQGIVKAHHGAVAVSSKPGVGTTFQVYFPACTEEVAPVIEATEPLRPGTERILFVDDEPALAEMGREMLESLGYRVVARTSSIEALKTFQAQPSFFDLVITDMTMPGLTGTELAARMLVLRPDQAIILCTGFSDQINAQQAEQMGIRQFMMKPWDINKMAAVIRRVLDRPGR